MNNTDFRRFVLDSSQKSPTSTSPTSKTRQDATPSSLGSRGRANIPMTPRTVQGVGGSVDFARQLQEHHNNGAPASKKFRSSAAPKGAKLSKGYVDRARERQIEQAEQTADDRESRVQALEEQLKLGQIDTATFEALRDQITGGDISATHLVKGLDRKLLERIRRGEDLSTQPSASKVENGDTTPLGEDKGNQEPEPDADEQLEELETRTVAPVQHEKVEKKGEMAPPPAPTQVAGAKRSRDAILAELKASRKAATAAAAAAANNTQAEVQSQLGSRFRKLGESSTPNKQPRIERDDKGREVLITVDEHGRVKRKVRKVAASRETTKPSLPMPDKAQQPLGMAVPSGIQPAKGGSPSDERNDDDDDIFQGVGDTFDPLEALKQKKSDTPHDANDNDNDKDSISTDTDTDSDTNIVHEDEDEGEGGDETAKQTQLDESKDAPLKPLTKHNYFNDKSPETETDTTAPASLNDPSILSSLQRAAALAAPKAPEADADADEAQSSKLSETAKRLLQRDRDMDDMDLGFGGSRFGDEEDEDGGGGKMKLAEWKGGAGAGDDDDSREGGKGGGGRRKRGKKKRKGDKESAADVLRVLEGRKGK